MLIKFLSFLHIFLLVTTKNISFAQTENLQDDYKNSLSFIETKSKCNYEDSGRRFTNEINNIGKCMNPFYNNEESIDNNVDVEKIANKNDERSLIALEIENYYDENNDDYPQICSYNINPTFDEICPLNKDD
ncbi:uncharacterized protein LOC127289039 isoform X2 [Leptopilina boulardi]|uniref:uncharacterized protein LOC127289039 isoform X2 n=1 Tax=Leptopilina boulardi TaxID=63433 RepID=UPI0021F630D3|nr:uncharacterized protein LOC127289039 isoform X2 [Leptopilina boulardi]